MRKTNKELQKIYREKMKASGNVWVGYWVPKKLRKKVNGFIKQLKGGK